MWVLRSYKTELKPNNKQRTVCLKHTGTARFVYNWGLGKRIDSYKNTGKTPNAIEQNRELNVLKKTTHLWIREVSKWAPQNALRDLDWAFTNFFAELKRELRRKAYPDSSPAKTGLDHLDSASLYEYLKIAYNFLKSEKSDSKKGTIYR